ncbi:MAG: hypothetical protein F6J93_12895 [Oscillatoria sp. SIO1A7]|nr:hypothetical protein [Oscillatoria sp. SIO1A7]
MTSSKETPQTAPKSNNSVAIKAITASALVLFTTFMIVHWQKLLSKAKTTTETAASSSVNKADTGTEEPSKAASEAAASRDSEVTEVETEGSESAAETAETEPEVTQEFTQTDTEVSNSGAESAETEPEVTEEFIETDTETSDSAAETVETEPEVTEEFIETDTEASDSAAETVETEPEVTEEFIETDTEVSDSAAETPEDSSATAEVTEDLYYEVYNKVDRSWRLYPTFKSNLAYKVNVKENGAIASYEPINEVAVDYLSETPMESLVDAGGKSEEPVASFLVVLTPSGRLEVSPWLAK